MAKLGFIGLGIMGNPMAKNLMKAGHELVVYDIIPEAVASLTSARAESAGSCKEVAQKTGIIITMLPNSPHVRAACLGENGIADGAKPGALVIDMSSIAPVASQDIAAALSEKGIRMIDAPVSGGEPKAIDGTLSIMCGGAQKDFDEALPFLKQMGADVTLVGKNGAGNTCKLANQIVVALNIAAVSEAFALSKKAGVDPELVFNAIKGGLAGSTVMNAKVPMILDRNFKPGFKVDFHIKDLGNALETGQDIGAHLPLTAFAMQIFQAIKADGEGLSDHSAMVKYYEKISGTEVDRG